MCPDSLGRVTQTQRLLDGVTYTMAQSYDALGRVVSETFPDGDSASYTYNEAGWLTSISGYITSISYNARGQRTSLTYANGVTSTWSYDATTFRVSLHQTTGGKDLKPAPLVALTGWKKSWEGPPELGFGSGLWALGSDFYILTIWLVARVARGHL